MAGKAPKARSSLTFSRTIKNTQPKEEWRIRLKEHSIHNFSHSFDVLLLIESNYKLCPATNEIEEQGEESTAVKFISPNSLIKFLNNTCASKPEYDYYGWFDDAFTELQEEYAKNHKLSPESMVYLIKLRILAFNEVIAHDRELIRELKFSLEQEMANINEQQTKEKDSAKGGKRPERKSKASSLKQNTLDYKYLQAKAGKLPNFVETMKVPTIYNTDYDEPDPENLYFVLSGIYDELLISALHKCNIALLSLIELGMEYQKFHAEEMPDDELDEFEFDRMLSLRNFWRSLEQEKTDIPKISRNSCYIKYSIPDPTSQKPSFDNFLILLKNITDFKRMYYHYYTTVRYLDVTEPSKPVCLSSMNNYNGLLDQVPNECITIPVMLHALIDEVCVRVDNWKNEQLESLNKAKKVKQRYHGGPVAQIKSLLRDYDCSHKKVTPIIKMPNAVKISYGNTLEYINAHVPINKYINTVEIALNQLKKMLPLKLFEIIDARNTFDVMFYNYVFSKWSEELVNVSAEELTLCVYAYLFTRGNFRKLSMPKVPNENAKVNKIEECMFGITKLYNEFHNVLTIKLNTSFFKPNASLHSDPLYTTAQTILDDEAINSCDNLSQQYKTFAQDLDSASFIQMINVAFNNYNHFDYKYFAPTDVILLRFHYINNKCGFSRKKENYFLRTPLCFRDFCYKLLLQESEWFLNEEKEYWKQVYINREKEKEYLLQHPKVNDYFDPKDFIIPGSIKYDQHLTRVSISRKTMTKSMKGEKKISKEEGEKQKSTRKSKDSIPSLRQSISTTNKVRYSVTVPLFEPYDNKKKYNFEIYNLGQSFYPLEFEEDFYNSYISVKLTKQKLPKKPHSCTFLVSSQDTNLVLHCEKEVTLKQVKPLHFNVNMTNGVVMVFSMPNPPVFHIENRHIVVNKISSDEMNRKHDSQKSFTNKISKSSATINLDPKVYELKNEVLQYLSIAMKEQLPVFKIISSRLHKYQYVKRVKSKVALPIGNIYRRVCCKPVLYKRLPKKHNVYEGKCIPYSDLINKERSPIDWKWNCSLPTGLSMETVQANVPHDFYIRQRYVIERTDLPSIQDEAYRCYLRCGIIMKFLKDGSIKTYSPDKTLSHYKYGYFSSNKHRASQASMKDVRLKRQTNIIPLHAYKKNLSALEKKIRKISNKYKRHLIDIADNYRFESSRADSRKLHKVYKLSKKIYTKDSHVIPLINHNVITSEGRYIDVKNNVVNDIHRKFEETRHRDYLLNETVTRREDGTAWMVDRNGNSITQFPDGSRIKTWYTILDENLILGEDPAEYQKRVENPLNTEEESLTKFCQTGEEFDMNGEEDVEILYSKEHMKDQVNNSGFVLIGMNYSFMHPNFATVSYYCWEDSSADILMADNIQVTAYAEGTYKLKLINNDIINVNNEDVEFIVNTSDSIKQESCFINLALFNVEKPKPDQTFLSVKENDAVVFVVSCDGQAINKRIFSPDTSTSDTENSICSDRMFVMKRDLSGIEMIREPIPYKFVHTLIDLKQVMSKKNHENVVMGPTKMKIFQPLKQTYSEHLMMMYDIPILATTKECLCLDKLWKLHDLDINTIMGKRSPLIIFERYISYLPTEVIVEQLAQAVLKCIIEGNENLPNINIIKELVHTEEIAVKAEVVEEKTSTKKFIPKHLTYKKHLERYKKLIKNDTIPRYFETVKGLMFLAVEECSEGAMEESIPKNDQPTDKKFNKKGRMSEIKSLTEMKRFSDAKKLAESKRYSETKELPGSKIFSGTKRLSEPKKPSETIRISEFVKQSLKNIEASDIKEKLDVEKQKIIKESRTILTEEQLPIQKHGRIRTSHISDTYQTKFNIPNHLQIHLRPNAVVHEIILTTKGLQIITDKNIENYMYPTRGSSNRSVGNDSFLEKKNKKPSALVKMSEPDAGQSSIDVNQNQKYPFSSFGEDIGAYFDSDVKIPSWDDSLCQKACINSLSTTSNTLVTIPETKTNEMVSCKQTTCACSVESIQRLAKCCRCNKYYCNCKDTYSAFSTCALQNELKISEAVCVLATKIIQTIEKDTEKFNLLHSKLENIIRDTANVWSMSEPITNDLIKTLKWIIENKIKAQNTIPEEQAINIVKQIEATISKIKISNRTVTLSIGNLQKMADLVLKMVCNSKNNSKIVKEIRKLLGNAQISRLDIIDTLKLAKEKIHLYYEYGLYPDLPIPEIPAESKCCKIAQYVDYLLGNILEGTCDKCNSISIVNNTSIHKMSPVNHRSKELSQKSGTATQECLLKKKHGQSTTGKNVTKKQSVTYEEMREEQSEYFVSLSNEKTNIIVEPYNYTGQCNENQQSIENQLADDEFDICSAGGFSMVKSCEEIVNVSIPFINREDTNNKNSDGQIAEYRGHENSYEDLHNPYILSKIKMPTISDVPAKSRETDIVTIMAPDQHDSGLTNENLTTNLLSPVMLHCTQETSKSNNTKPIVYDGNIISK